MFYVSLKRTKVYYGLLREPDVTAFVENMEDEEEEPSALNTSATGSKICYKIIINCFFKGKYFPLQVTADIWSYYWLMFELMLLSTYCYIKITCYHLVNVIIFHLF